MSVVVETLRRRGMGENKESGGCDTRVTVSAWGSGDATPAKAPIFGISIFGATPRARGPGLLTVPVCKRVRLFLPPTSHTPSRLPPSPPLLIPYRLFSRAIFAAL